MPVIGILGSARAEGWATRTGAFMQGLKEAGFIEGQNVAIEARWADDRYDQLSAMAAELVRARVALIVAISNSLPCGRPWPVARLAPQRADQVMIIDGVAVQRYTRSSTSTSFVTTPISGSGTVSNCTTTRFPAPST